MESLKQSKAIRALRTREDIRISQLDLALFYLTIPTTYRRCPKYYQMILLKETTEIKMALQITDCLKRLKDVGYITNEQFDNIRHRHLNTKDYRKFLNESAS